MRIANLTPQEVSLFKSMGLTIMYSEEGHAKSVEGFNSEDNTLTVYARSEGQEPHEYEKYTFKMVDARCETIKN